MDTYERRYEDLKLLVEHAELRDIEFHELSAKLRQDRPESEETSEAEVDLMFQTRIGDADFGVRVAVTVTADGGDAQAVVAAEYEVEAEYLPDQELLNLFSTEVAMMAVFPYIREGIQSATMRVFGKPLTLPIMRRGEIQTENTSQV